MNNAQRALSVGAFGAGCVVAANATNKWLNHRNADGGWFNYAPDNGVVFTPSGGILREVLVWAIAIVVWFAVSHRVLGSNDDT